MEPKPNFDSITVELSHHETALRIHPAVPGKTHYHPYLQSLISMHSEVDQDKEQVVFVIQRLSHNPFCRQFIAQCIHHIEQAPNQTVPLDSTIFNLEGFVVFEQFREKVHFIGQALRNYLGIENKLIALRNTFCSPKDINCEFIAYQVSCIFWILPTPLRQLLGLKSLENAMLHCHAQRMATGQRISTRFIDYFPILKAPPHTNANMGNNSSAFGGAGMLNPKTNEEADDRSENKDKKKNPLKTKASRGGI
ncbi:MAG TPA: hypothetical protein VJ205_01160 [Gammaproteobacteria bacterium]|nr:hypothetical protein [Gammaproteobacteria bacterium]